MKYAKKLIARIALAVIIIVSILTLSSSPVSTSPLPLAKEPAVASLKKKTWACKNVLARNLHKAGFRGENLREAWAIAMRESGGRPDAVSATNDHGVFQFNYAAWHKSDWWDTSRLHNRTYNITIAYRLSRGGKTWYPWDISGKGEHLGRYSSSSTYAAYKNWYKKYPCAA